MGYVAIKGGEDAIKNSLSFYEEEITKNQNVSDKDIEDSLKYAVDKVMSEGSLYSKN
jgi:alpha-D-ribose 1-methylphosphonate 5-triphosphate synthase subunit PhnI